jgi:hypothetical protein
MTFGIPFLSFFREAQLNIPLKLRKLDSLEDMNSKLKTNYRATVFDFAYLLAIALNDNFVPQSSLGLTKKELAKVRKNLAGLGVSLRNKKRRLSKYIILDEITSLVSNKIDIIDFKLNHASKGQGRLLSEKAKLILLWSQLMLNNKMKPLSKPGVESFMGINYKISQRSAPNINWNDLSVLLAWFHRLLKDCSYSSYINLNSNLQKEKLQEKSSLKKNQERYERSANFVIWEFRLRQNYYIDKKRGTKRPAIPRRFLPYRLPPITRVCFNVDNIEISEQRTKTTEIKKTWFINGQKKHEKVATIKGREKVPIVCLPNGQTLLLKKYTPPFFPSSNEVDLMIRDFREEILKNS